MVKRCGLMLVALSVGIGTATAQDAKTVLANASKALGADTLKTVQYHLAA